MRFNMLGRIFFEISALLRHIGGLRVGIICLAIIIVVASTRRGLKMDSKGLSCVLLLLLSAIKGSTISFALTAYSII